MNISVEGEALIKSSCQRISSTYYYKPLIFQGKCGDFREKNLWQKEVLKLIFYSGLGRPWWNALGGSLIEFCEKEIFFGKF